MNSVDVSLYFGGATKQSFEIKPEAALSGRKYKPIVTWPFVSNIDILEQVYHSIMLFLAQY